MNGPPSSRSCRTSRALTRIEISGRRLEAPRRPARLAIIEPQFRERRRFFRKTGCTLASSDALVHAGDKETFGLIVIEAMSSGIPVVALNRKPINELVSAQAGILVDRRDSRSFAAGIEALYTMDRQCLGRVARELAERCWNWDALMPDLLAHYTRLADAHSIRDHFTS